MVEDDTREGTGMKVYPGTVRGLRRQDQHGRPDSGCGIDNGGAPATWPRSRTETTGGLRCSLLRRPQHFAQTCMNPEHSGTPSRFGARQCLPGRGPGRTQSPRHSFLTQRGHDNHLESFFKKNVYSGFSLFDVLM